MTHCTDAELLMYEPDLALDASLASQTILRSRAMLLRDQLTLIHAADTNQLQPARVLILPGQIAAVTGLCKSDHGGACYAVVGVSDSPEGCRVIHVRRGPSSPGFDVPIEVELHVRTFWAQRRVISELISRARSSCASGRQPLADTRELRRPTMLGTLHLIYSSLAATSDEVTDHTIRVEMYQRLYRRSLRSIGISSAVLGAVLGTVCGELCESNQ